MPYGNSSSRTCFVRAEDECCSDDNNRNPWADAAMWWMLVAIVFAIIMSSVSAIPRNIMKYDQAFAKEAQELHIPFLKYKWAAPLFTLGAYITYFLSTYLVYRRIEAMCEWSDSRKNTTKSMLSLIYIVNLVLLVLATWALLGTGAPYVALLFVCGLVAANIWQLIYTTRITTVGAYWLIIPFVVMNCLFTFPITVAGIFFQFKGGKGEGFFSKPKEYKASKNTSSFIDDLNRLAP